MAKLPRKRIMTQRMRSHFRDAPYTVKSDGNFFDRRLRFSNNSSSRFAWRVSISPLPFQTGFGRILLGVEYSGWWWLMNTIKRYIGDKSVLKQNYLSMNGDFVGRIIGFFVYETSFVKSNRNPSHIRSSARLIDSWKIKGSRLRIGIQESQQYKQMCLISVSISRI